MKTSRWLNHFSSLIFVFTLLNAALAFAGPSRTTYQAKIVKPDGYPLEASSVNFKFTILDPAGSCVIYSETYNAVNMASTGGLISFSLGSGVKTFPVSATTFEQIFSNITPNLACDTGGAPAVYTPLANDARKIVMQFHDGGGWQTLPAMNINAVPYAMYANDSQKFNGMIPSDFVQVSTIPTCAASQALAYTGSAFQCVAAGGGSVTSGSVVTALGFTPADGASVTAVTTYAANVSATVFSVSSTVSSLQSSVAASFAAMTSSQWLTSGTTISYDAGKVGVGTSNPSAAFEVQSATNNKIASFIGSPTGLNQNVTFQVLNQNASAPALSNQDFSMIAADTLKASGITGGVALIGLGHNYSGAYGLANEGVLTAGTQSVGLYINNRTSGDLRFGTNSTEHLRILKSSGNVGIKTSTPATALDVSGGIRIGTESAACAPGLAGTLRYNAGVVEYCNGAGWSAFGISGAGILAINGLTSGSQTFALGSTGTSPNVSSTGTIHTFNFPLASAGSVTAGLLSNADYTTFMNKITSSAASIAQVLGYTPASATALANYLVRASNLSDLASSATARTNLGVGYVGTLASVDLGSADVSGTLAIARTPAYAGDVTKAVASNTLVLSSTGVVAGTYNKVTVDAKGRVTSSSALTSADVTTALGFTPGAAASGVTSLNGSVSQTQTFATGTTGTAPSFATANGVHTLNIPLASAGSVTGGLLSNADYTTFMNKITSSAASIAQVLGYVPASATALGNYAVRANNLSDLASSATARTNLGVGYIGTLASVDLGSADVSGTLAIARTPAYAGDVTKAVASNTLVLSNTGVVAGTYNKVTVDAKGRITSSSALSTSDVTTALGYTPASASASTQWTTSGTTINYQTGNVGVGTAAPSALIHAHGALDQTLFRVSTASASLFVGEDTDLPTIIRFRPAVGSGVAITGANDTPGILVNSANSYVAIGGNFTPTAGLHIRAGTGSSAPLKFTSGTLTVSPQSGTMEYDGSFYLTDGSGVRRMIATGASSGSVDNASNINSSGNITMTPLGGSVIVSATTSSVNSATGALVVGGGVGIGGDANIGGTVTATNAIMALSTGMVGVGASIPTAKLDVRSEGTIKAARIQYSGTNFSTQPNLELFRSRGTIDAPTAVLANDTIGAITALGHNGTSFGVGSTAAILFKATQNYNSTDSGTYMTFNTTASGTNTQLERMRLDNAGQLGIGTSAPASILHASTGTNGDGVFTLSADTDDSNENDNPRIALLQDAGTVGVEIGFSNENTGNSGNTFSIARRYGSATDWSTFNINTANGRIGMGTSAPTDVLHVVGTVARVKVESTTGSTGVQIKSIDGSSSNIEFGDAAADSTGLISYVHSNESMRFNTSGTEKMRIDTDGNVGIGKTTPDAKLDVNGIIRSSIGNGTFFIMRETATSAAATTDGIRWGYEDDLFSTNQDGVVFEKTDANASVVDGGFLFANRGSGNVRTPALAIRGAGVGVGLLNPGNARLTITSGSTVYAPLKFTSGTLNTTPQRGAMEFDGNTFYLTDDSGLRKSIFIGTSTTAITAANLQGTELTATSATITPYLYGSTASGGSLRIEATTHATKGNILMGASGTTFVGVGVVSAPLGPLHVQGGLDPTMGTEDDDDGIVIQNFQPTLTFKDNTVSDPDDLRLRMNQSALFFETSPDFFDSAPTTTTLMTLSASGYLGLGITNPSHGLHVVNSGTSMRGLRIVATASNTAAFAEAQFATDAREYRTGVGSASETQYAVAGKYYLYDAVSNTMRVVLDQMGNMGIGSSAPNARLTVSRTTTLGSQVGISNQNYNGYLTIPTANEGIIMSSSKYDGANWISDSAGAAAVTVGEGTIQMFTNTGLTPGASHSYTERMRVDNLGNLLIGTTTAHGRLAVESTGSTYLSLNTTSTTTKRTGVYFRSGGTTQYEIGVDVQVNNSRDWYLYDSVSSTPRIVVNANGYVGVGTIAPKVPLDVNGIVGTTWGTAFNTSFDGSWRQTTSGFAGLLQFDVPTGKFYFWNTPASATAGSINPFPVQSLTIDKNGNVGIATAAPAAKLHVNGDARINAIVGGENNGSGNFHLDAWSSGGDRSVYLNWGSGTGGAKVGNGSATWGPISASAFNVSSDKRLKENIKPIENPLEKILKIDAVRFTWKNESRNKQEGERIGLIAQNVEKVFPQAVRLDKGENTLPGGTKLVTYSDLVSPIIAAIQEFYKLWVNDSKDLHNKVESQSREIASVKDENEKLKQQNAEKDKQLNDIRAYLCAKDPNAPICN